MGLKRHAIAHELIIEAGGDFTADRLELRHRINDLCRRFNITYSTMRAHLCKLEQDGVLVARHPLVICPTALATIDQPTSTPPRPALTLITGEGDQPSRAPDTAPVESLWQLGIQAIAARDPEALQIVVQALVEVATTDRDRATPLARNREIAPPQNRDFRENSEVNEVKPSVHSIPEPHAPEPSRRESRRPGAIPQSKHDNGSSPATPLPDFGSEATNRAVETVWATLLLNPDADATPAWMRSGYEPPTTLWTDLDTKKLTETWRAHTGEALSNQLQALLSIWTPDQASAAVTAVCADRGIASKGGRLRNAAVLGYHRYFPLDTASPLPYWDVWTKDRSRQPADLIELRAQLESLAAISGQPIYAVRVAAAIAPFTDQLDRVLDWGCITVDKQTLEDIVAAYEPSIRGNQR